ncbi:MAG: FAD-dependent oxidoreductase [Nocardioidaceae bacterium]
MPSPSWTTASSSSVDILARCSPTHSTSAPAPSCPRCCEASYRRRARPEIPRDCASRRSVPMRVIVIGAGVIGASVAAALARRGADVTIVEARAPGAGTSSTSFAWVNANSKEPRSYFDLNYAGVQAHHRLASEGADWWAPTGNLEWACSEADEARLHSRASRLQEWGYAVRWLTAAEAHDLEPDARIPDNARAFAFFPEEGCCFPMLLLARLLGEATDRGAGLVPFSAVTAVESTPNGVTVALARSDTRALQADAVVSCVGRWTSELLGVIEGVYDVPVLGPGHHEEATLGYLATTFPAPVRLSRVLTTPSLNVRPAGGGSLLLQALDLDPQTAPDQMPTPSGSLAEGIVARAASVLPRAAGVTVRQLVLGRRAMPADGLTAAGFIDAGQRVYAIATHSGVTLAPLLGDLAARELHGETVEDLAPFRPSRFEGQDYTAPKPARRAGEQ